MKNFLNSISSIKSNTHKLLTNKKQNIQLKYFNEKIFKNNFNKEFQISQSSNYREFIIKKNHKNNFLQIQSKNFSRIDYTYDTRDFLSKTSEYENKIEDSSMEYNFKNDPLTGFATAEATEKYSQRNKEEIHKEHFRKLFNEEIKISSIGLGTYIGAPDDINDFYIYNAVKTCVLSGGVNLIDTAINYRYMKSEKAIGKALNTLVNKYGVQREELFICSKIGYVPEDAEGGRRAHSFVQELVEDKKIDIEDVIFDEKNRPIHCMHPEFLEQQMTISLENLGLNTLDLMYLHNAVESQGAVLTPELFEKRLTKAFEFLVKIF